LQESSLERPPPINQAVPLQDALKPFRVGRGGLDELEQAGFHLIDEADDLGNAHEEVLSADRKWAARRTSISEIRRRPVTHS